MKSHFANLSTVAVAEVVPHPDNIQMFGFRCFEGQDTINVPIIDPNDDTVIELSKFYCTSCRKWLKLSGTIGNIRSHIKSRHPNLLTVPDQLAINQVEKNRLAKQYILLNGLPFSTAEDEIFAQLCPGIGSRKTMSALCTEVALKVKKGIAMKLVNASLMWITFDGWSDAASQEYLGVQAHVLYQDKFCHFCLAHQPLSAVRVDAPYIAGVMSEILTDYNIPRNKISGYVSDTTNLMPAIANVMHGTWVPCFCHVMNLMVETFIQSCEGKLDYLFTLQRFLGSSTVFHNYLLQDPNCVARALPSYSKTRWYSLFKLLKNIIALQGKIEAFIPIYNASHPGSIIPVPPGDFFPQMCNLIEVISTARNAMLAMESDTFGSISQVIDCFRMLNFSVHSLDQNIWGDATLAFDGRYDELFTNGYFQIHRSALIVAARLNPFMMSGTSVTHAEITDADDIISQTLATRQPQQPQQRPMNRQPGEYGMNLRVFGAAQGNAIPASELSQYQNMIGSLGEGDLFQFWIGNMRRLPILSRYALEVLLCPASSAASERDFSKAKRTISIRRLAMRRSKISDAVMIVANQDIAKQFIH